MLNNLRITHTKEHELFELKLNKHNKKIRKNTRIISNRRRVSKQYNKSMLLYIICVPTAVVCSVSSALIIAAYFMKLSGY